jgi:hypothetical protein
MSVLPSVLGVAAIAWLLARSWGDVADAVRHASAPWLWACLGLAAAAVVGHAAAWVETMRVNGGVVERSRPGLTVRYLAGALGKYVPGGIWSVVGLGEAARRAGASRARAYAGFLQFVITLYAANAAMAGVLALVFLDGWARALGLVGPLALAALHPALLAQGLALLRRVTRRPLDVPVPSWRQSLRIAAVSAPSWLLVAAATWAAARALLPDPDGGRVALAALLSWLVGFLAGPVPAGAGIREAVFVVASGLPAAEATAVALVARAAFMVADGAGGAVALAVLAA